jgi:hypothetical protein
MVESAHRDGVSAPDAAGVRREQTMARSLALPPLPTNALA